MAHVQHTGDIVWAYAYQESKDSNNLLYYQKPILGMLTRTKNSVHDPSRPNANPSFFVPFKKNSKSLDPENLAWSKAVSRFARKYADSEEQAIVKFNREISFAILYHEKIIKEHQKHMIAADAAGRKLE